jgi:hypothetical protein
VSVVEQARPPSARGSQRANHLVRGNSLVPVLVTVAMTVAFTGLFVASAIGISHFGNVLPPSSVDQFLTAVLVVAAIIVGSAVAFSVMLVVMAVRQAVAARSGRRS